MCDWHNRHRHHNLRRRQWNETRRMSTHTRRTRHQRPSSEEAAVAVEPGRKADAAVRPSASVVGPPSDDVRRLPLRAAAAGDRLAVEGSSPSSSSSARGRTTAAAARPPPAPPARQPGPPRPLCRPWWSRCTAAEGRLADGGGQRRRGRRLTRGRRRLRPRRRRVETCCRSCRCSVVVL